MNTTVIEMDDSEIQDRLNELDAGISKDDAKLLISYNEGAAFCDLIANRKGFLRAGIEMLRAAVAPLGLDESVTPIDLNYLIGDKGLFVRRLIRRDNVEPEILQPKKRSWKSKAAGFGCLAIIVCLMICALVGIAQLAVWIFGR
jgi:hypothetical protein